MSIIRIHDTHCRKEGSIIDKQLGAILILPAVFVLKLIWLVTTNTVWHGPVHCFILLIWPHLAWPHLNWPHFLWTKRSVIGHTATANGVVLWSCSVCCGCDQSRCTHL